MLRRAGKWLMLALSLTAASSCLGKAATESEDVIIRKSMSGYKMKIPSHLILATMQYAEGTDEQEVTDFDFVLELPNLDEVLTPDQRARLSNPPPPTEGHGFAEEWLTGTMSTSLPIQYGGNYPLDRFNFWRNDVLKDGPYNKVADKFGLNHWIIDDQKYKNPDQLAGSISEFYYSYETNTIITCKSSKTIINPIYTFSTCEQSFNIEKYSATVIISYSKIWLKNWAIMQNKITKKFIELNT